MADEEPVWNGRGGDPWLPDRVAALLQAAGAEARMFREFWRFMRRWLGLVRDRMRASRYDPTVIPALVPAWYDAMTEYAEGPILETMEQGYRAVTGEGYTVDAEQNALNRAWSRRNQLTGVADSVYVLVQREVANALREGVPGDELADRLDTLLDATATPRWANRSAVIARTETLGALNGGRSDGQATMARRLGGEWERVWIATLDTRTRATHAAADGQRIPLGAMFAVGEAQLRWPGDPLGPPEETIQCRCTTVLVRPGQTTDIGRRA